MITAPVILLLGFFSPGPMELIIIGVIAVLLFGSRLPEVGRSLGRSLVEFKRGIRGVEEEVNRAVYSADTRRPGRSYHDVEDREEATAPKFEPPPAVDTADSADSPPGGSAAI
jgi:sec-independent protein translocase protein TatA